MPAPTRATSPAPPVRLEIATLAFEGFTPAKARRVSDCLERALIDLVAARPQAVSRLQSSTREHVTLSALRSAAGTPASVLAEQIARAVIGELLP